MQSDSNRLLIHFFDPIPVVRSTRHDDSIRIRTIYIKTSLIYIKIWSTVIKNYQKTNVFWRFGCRFWYILTFNWLLQSFNQLFWSFIQTFRSLNRSLNWNGSNLDPTRLQSSTRFRCWILNQTEIDDRNWHAWNSIADNSIPIPESH